MHASDINYIFGVSSKKRKIGPSLERRRAGSGVPNASEWRCGVSIAAVRPKFARAYGT